MRITRKIAERMYLYEADNHIGAKRHNAETLDEFMQRKGIPFGSSLKHVNEQLAKNGLIPYTPQEIRAFGMGDAEALTR